jgi:hypothetical protein
MLLRFLKSLLRYISKFRTLDVNFVFNFITSTIAILAILTAFDFFSKKPEVEVKIVFDGSKPEAKYNPDNIVEFYSEYNFKIPNILSPLLFIPEEDSLSNLYLTTDWTNDLQIFYLLKNIPKIYALDDYVKIRTEELDKDLSELRVHGTMMMGGEYGWSDWKFRKILSELKENKISEKDYYIFLCAGINRRTITQTVRVNNNGAIDLKDFNLVIHAPFSRVTKSQSGNILSTNFLSARTLFSTKSDSQSTTLSFQNLRKGESIFADVTTRENKLKEADIGYTYKEENILDTNVLWSNTTIIFVIMIILTAFFNKNNRKVIES